MDGDSSESKDIATIYFTHLDRDEMDSIGINSDSLPSGATLSKGMLSNALHYSRDIRQLIALSLKKSE